MLKKMLIIAGLLSLVSVSAQAEPIVITNNDQEIGTIENMTTDNGNGGAILNGEGYNLIISGNISNNTLQNTIGQAVFGGGIYQSSGKLTINDGVTFDSNIVTSKSQTYPTWDGVDSASGGAIFITGDFTMETKGNVTFSKNQAIAMSSNDESNGGAIFAQGSSPDASMTFENVKFDKNSSATRGGAIYNGDTDIKIEGKGEFNGNSSKTGGAVYNLDTTNNTKFTTGTGTIFTKNTATGNGGAIANFDGVVNICKDNEFSGNTATGNGGAIYNANWQKTSVTNIEGGTSFTNNTAKKAGGAIYTTGTVNIDTTDGNVTFSQNTSNKGADIYLDKGSQLVVKGTDANNKISFGSQKSIAGEGSITHESAGTFELKDNQNLNDFTGTYIQTSGKTLLDNSTIFNKFDIQLGELELTKGSIATIDGVNKKFSGSAITIIGSTLNLKTSIDDAVNIDVQSNSILNLSNNATLTISNGDNWEGRINSDKGKLLVDGYQAEVTYTQTNGGEITLTNSSDITLKDKNSSISSGNVNIEGNSTLTVANAAEISGTASTTAKSGSTVNVSGGTINSTGKTTLETNSVLNITNNGSVTLHSNDSWKGIINLGTKGLDNDNSSLIIGLSDDNRGVLNAYNGNLSLLSGANLTISSNENNNSYIDDAVALDIQKGSTLNLEATELNLDSKDDWHGHINNKDGSIINAKGVTDASGSLNQEDGKLNLSQSSKITLNSDSSVTGGEIKIEDNSSLTIVNAELTNKNNTNMTLDANSVFNAASADKTFSLNNLNTSAVTNADGSIQASLINVMNAQLNRANIENLGIDTQANFNIDILGRSSLRNDSDKFTVGALTKDGTIRIDDWTFFGDVYGYDAPIDRHVQLGDIFINKDGNQLEASIETTDKTNFSPIGWYQLNKGAGAGNYTLDLVKLNPQVFRGQVATVSQWMNQLSIDDMLFTHSMVLPSFKDEDGGKMANHYAATDALFAPYQYSRKDGGLWVKAYGTFEHLQMNNGLKHVGNNSYGTLIGADFGLKDLKNGWKFMPTAYVGYNGAHQYWSDVSQYQNGGQAGFLGTWYKNNFIIGALAYGGVYGNNMDVAGHTDETFNYFAGTAGKASYNIRVHRDFVIQPNLMVAYNYFGQQNWHSNFGQMGMMAGMLHGVNIAPGINFIWERDTFSAYLTLQYMYNVNGASGGKAGNVHLPQMEMERGFIQYGIGFTKKFTDRASGYFQAVLRNVGRTGVGFQAGFIYRLGK